MDRSFATPTINYEAQSIQRRKTTSSPISMIDYSPQDGGLRGERVGSAAKIPLITDDENKSEAKSCTSHIFRSIVVFLSLAVCIYETATLVDKYFDYETSVNVKVKNIKELKEALPGITICSTNRVKITSLPNYPELAVKMEEITNANISDEQQNVMKTNLLQDRVKEFEANNVVSNYLDAGPQNQEFIGKIECDREGWKNSNRDYSLNDLCSNVKRLRSVERIGNCFTMFHQSAMIAMASHKIKDYDIVEDAEDNAYLGITLKEKTYLAKQIIEFELDFGSDNYTDYSIPPGGKLNIHSSRNIPSISKMGYHLLPGKVYGFYIKKSTTKGMPPPYKTMCYDYSKKFEEKQNSEKREKLIDLKTPMSRESCIEVCVMENIVTSCKCWPSNIPFQKETMTERERNLKFCSYEETQNCTLQYKSGCESNCPNDCLIEHYDIVVKESMKPTNETLRELEDMIEYGTLKKHKKLKTWKKIYAKQLKSKKDKAIVQIIFQTTEETIHEHEESTRGVELVCNVAGLSGIFIGISFLGLFDYMEFFFTKLSKMIKK